MCWVVLRFGSWEDAFVDVLGRAGQERLRLGRFCRRRGNYTSSSSRAKQSLACTLPNLTIMASAKPRVYILTGAVAAITATGAWYGAGLKTRHEFKQVFPSSSLPNSL